MTAVSWEQSGSKAFRIELWPGYNQQGPCHKDALLLAGPRILKVDEPPETVPMFGDQVVTDMSLWGTLHIQIMVGTLTALNKMSSRGKH